MALHVIVGAGPVGGGTAIRLAELGHSVRVLTRSGAGPVHEAIERVSLDASDATALTEATEGAAALYNCANPPYDKWPAAWPPLAQALLTAAEHTGAGLVIMGNLYAYGPVPDGLMTESTPLASTETKGRIRAQMWNEAAEADHAGRIRATEVRASDYFGPTVLNSHVADRFVPVLLKGKKARTLGDPDQPHSWTYMPDVTATLAHVGTCDDGWGRAWHVPTGPAVSARALASLVSAAGGRGAEPKVGRIPDAVVRAMALGMPVMRELRAMSYQFDRPFVLDSTVTEQALGLRPTPIDEQVAATVAWWQARAAG